jgi:hypothetical protein
MMSSRQAIAARLRLEKRYAFAGTCHPFYGGLYQKIVIAV